MILIRKTNEEMQELCKKLSTDRLWSWSRINCVHNSLYEYYLKYIAHKKPDNENSIYTVTGGISHDILEKFYSNEITKEQMIYEFEDGWLTAFDISELKFDRNDDEKNENIAKKYYYNLQHFFKNHKTVDSKIVLEQFITVKIGSEYYQGYIDALIKDKNGNYVILDWKTSSIYKGKKAENECGQLCMYAMAIHQMGIPYEKIKIAWNFLKYQNVEVQMKNGTKKVREIERCKIGESLQSNAKMWLKTYGYSEDDIFDYLSDLENLNDISVLPKEIQDKYKCYDCCVYVELTGELVKYWENFIIDTTSIIREKEKLYKETHDERIWFENEEQVKKQSYYFANLCSYSANLHKPYKLYLENLDKQNENKNNMFDGVGSEIPEDDLSWLDMI